MKEFRYLKGVSTLILDSGACEGCGECRKVCPHAVFVIEERKARIADHDACMECGACARNCPTGALKVNPGTGCAAYIIQCWLKGKENSCCC